MVCWPNCISSTAVLFKFHVSLRSIIRRLTKHGEYAIELKCPNCFASGVT